MRIGTARRPNRPAPHVHRHANWKRGGEWVRISSDGGNTWEKETYYLTATPATFWPAYGAMCVLPPHLADGKPGMILSVIGERKYAGHEARMQAIRWRPLPK